MDKSSQNDETKALAAFIPMATRSPKKGTRMALITQHLIASVESVPLRKIRLILEAAWLLSQRENEKLEIDEKFIRIAYAVVITLLNKIDKKVYKLNPNGTYDERRIITLGWNIPNTKEAAYEYMGPWFIVPLNYWFTELTLREQQTLDDDDWFFKGTRVLTPKGFRAIEGNFIAWGMPKAMQIKKKLPA